MNDNSEEVLLAPRQRVATRTDVLLIKRILKNDVPLAGSPTKRRIYVVLGHFALFIGLLNFIIPVIPTSPFIILAAYCYARGSRRFLVWLLTNHWLGRPIRNWYLHGIIPRKTKITIIFLLMLMVGISVIFIIPVTWLRVLMAVVMLAVILYIIRVPSA